MIPTAFITPWRENAPWIENSQVEQDRVTVEKTVEKTVEETVEKTVEKKRGT